MDAPTGATPYTYEEADLARAGDPRLWRGPEPVVAQIVPRLDGGGVEQGTVDVARALVQAGARAVVVTAGGWLTRALERVGAQPVIMPVDSKNPLTLHRNMERLSALTYEQGIDILHARSRAPAWSAIGAAKRTGAAFMTTFHGTYNFSNAIKKRYNAVMARGERVIAISDFIAEHVIDVYGAEKSRLRTIPRGIDMSIFNPDHVSPERIIQLSDKWALPDDMRVVMLPGRLARWKGHEVLIEAMARLDRRDVLCVFVGADHGSAGYRAELESQIQRRGLRSQMALLDFTDDMPAAYMLADVVVSASTDPEAFGRIVVEAQAMGRPVVATNHGGARETLDGGRTGWLVTPGDPAALATALKEALALDQNQRASLARLSRAHVESQFSRTLMTQRTLAVYEDLMAERRLRALTPGMKAAQPATAGASR